MSERLLALPVESPDPEQSASHLLTNLGRNGTGAAQFLKAFQLLCRTAGQHSVHCVMNETNIEHQHRTLNFERAAKTWFRTSTFDVQCSVFDVFPFTYE